MKEPKQCSQRVWRSNSFRSRPCLRPVKLTDADGKHWCATHDPDAVEVRKRKTAAKWKARFAAQSEGWDRKASLTDIANAALAWRAGDRAGALDSPALLKHLAILADEHLKRWPSS